MVYHAAGAFSNLEYLPQRPDEKYDPFVIFRPLVKRTQTVEVSQVNSNSLKWAVYMFLKSSGDPSFLDTLRSLRTVGFRPSAVRCAGKALNM